MPWDERMCRACSDISTYAGMAPISCRCRRTPQKCKNEPFATLPMALARFFDVQQMEQTWLRLLHEQKVKIAKGLAKFCTFSEKKSELAQTLWCHLDAQHQNKVPSSVGLRDIFTS